MALADEIGVVAWYSLMTKDVAASNAYYTRLFGWGVEDFAMPDGESVPLYIGPKGHFANPVPLEGDGVPTHWITYFAVADVDASCRKVTELGGTVCVEPFDLESVGRTAVVTDPAGAAFHLFTPEKADEPVNIMGGEPGMACWLELMVDDPETVKDFYAGVLGWRIEVNRMGGGGEDEVQHSDEPIYFDYLIGHSAETMVAGIMKRPEEMPPTPPMWMPYFMVESIEASTAKAKELGGKPLFGPMAIPGIGQFTLVMDPAGGAVSYLFQGESE